ncbi:MAG: hypothetical protein SFU85_11595 [Candidatus Methylacidiphilales bacterium]|nr:hypothetical protein [Candidatus Methylacidiphilales bacterium]
MEAEKKREWATYRKLDLQRQHKSRAKRDALASGGLHLFIGGSDPDRPWLKVARADYVRVWKEVDAELARDQPDPAARELLRVRHEQMVYDRLLAQSSEMRGVGDTFQKSHGRAMTTHERELYARISRDRDHSPLTPQERAKRVRSLWMHGLMDKIRRNQSGNPQRMQQIWAEVVGPEAAQDSTLDYVDAVRGLAVCRTTSSIRAQQLKREPGLAAKLGQALGQKITRIAFR